MNFLCSDSVIVNMHVYQVKPMLIGAPWTSDVDCQSRWLILVKMRISRAWIFHRNVSTYLLSTQATLLFISAPILISVLTYSFHIFS